MFLLLSKERLHEETHSYSMDGQKNCLGVQKVPSSCLLNDDYMDDDLRFFRIEDMKAEVRRIIDRWYTLMQIDIPELCDIPLETFLDWGEDTYSKLLGEYIAEELRGVSPAAEYYKVVRRETKALPCMVFQSFDRAIKSPPEPAVVETYEDIEDYL